MHGRSGFSKRAVLRASVGTNDATRDADVTLRGRETRPIRAGCDPVYAPEARGEGPDARQAYGEADIGHRTIGIAQQVRRALESPGEEVLVWGLPERTSELSTEVRR